VADARPPAGDAGWARGVAAPWTEELRGTDDDIDETREELDAATGCRRCPEHRRTAGCAGTP
jgi:hypothetical protein